MASFTTHILLSLLNEVTRLSWINEVKYNKLSVLTRATDGVISVLNEVSRASFITAGQINEKASYWLFILSQAVNSMHIKCE